MWHSAVLKNLIGLSIFSVQRGNHQVGCGGNWTQSGAATGEIKKVAAQVESVGDWPLTHPLPPVYQLTGMQPYG